MTERATIGHNGPPTLIEQIDQFVCGVELGDEVSPDEIAALDRWARFCVIQAALTLNVARANRNDLKKSPTAIGVLYYIAVRSDNQHARCTDSAERMASYLGCYEQTVRRALKLLIEWGLVRIEPRAGKSPAVWITYPSASLEMSSHDVVLGLAPERAKAGRPTKKTPGTDVENPGHHMPDVFEKTPGTMSPDISEKPRAQTPKTPGMETENPGHMVPDGNNSCKYSSKNSEVKSAPATAKDEAPLQGDNPSAGASSDQGLETSQPQGSMLDNEGFTQPGVGVSGKAFRFLAHNGDSGIVTFEAIHRIGKDLGIGQPASRELAQEAMACLVGDGLKRNKQGAAYRASLAVELLMRSIHEDRQKIAAGRAAADDYLSGQYPSADDDIPPCTM